MEELDIHHIESILLFLLVFVALFGAISQRLKIPYPIVLVIAGFVLSLVPGTPRVRLDPEMVFLAFLPPLLFAAAFNTSWRSIRHNLVSILALGFGLVGFTVFGVAMVTRWILPGFDWELGLVLGAVVSTTDAIAATAIAKRIHLPQRIVDVLEGESLVNDASGLLALEFTVGLLVNHESPTLTGGIVKLIWLVAGGIAIGMLLGKLIRWIENYVDDAPIEITMSIIMPYAVYLAAERVGSSGVLAAVACGLYLGRESSHYFSSRVRIEAYAVWDTLTFILNGIVFLLIGLQLPHILAGIHTASLAQMLIDGALFSAIVIALRLIWAFPGLHASYFIRRLLGENEPTPNPRTIFIVGWTGMRGVVSLAAAISLPETLADGTPFPQRDTIIFLTFCVIFVTLVMQGLTLPALIRKLGLTEPHGRGDEEAAVRRLMIQAALDELAIARQSEEPENSAVYQEMESLYRRYLAHEGGANVDHGDELSAQHVMQYRVLSSRLRNVERSTLLALHNSKSVSDEVLRTLQRELDLADTRFSNS
jgi:monovalent cation/hydrogen antiporter